MKNLKNILVLALFLTANITFAQTAKDSTSIEVIQGGHNGRNGHNGRSNNMSIEERISEMEEKLRKIEAQLDFEKNARFKGRERRNFRENQGPQTRRPSPKRRPRVQKKRKSRFTRGINRIYSQKGKCKKMGNRGDTVKSVCVHTEDTRMRRSI